MTEVPAHIRGLVFDCDGTIADTMPTHYRAWVAAFGEHGREFPEEMFYAMAGVPTDRIVEIFNRDHAYGLPVQETALRKDTLFSELLSEVAPIEPVVRLVHKYAGVLPMAVASGGTRVLVTRTLDILELGELFDAIVTAEDVVHGKPAPDIFLEAARRIGVMPKNCCAFEDGEMGLRAARDAGMMVVDIRPMLKR